MAAFWFVAGLIVGGFVVGCAQGIKQMDETDVSVLRCLKRTGIEPRWRLVEKLKKETGLPEQEIWDSLRRLEDKNLILGGKSDYYYAV